MAPIIGPPTKENIKKLSPIGPLGILVPRIVIKEKPTTKNRMIEVNSAPPRMKKNPVSFLALLGS